MIREWEVEHILFIMLLLNLGLFFLFIGIIEDPTGRITAEGGTTREVNVTTPFSDVNWGLLYGNMSSSGAVNFTLGKGTLVQENLPSFNPGAEHIIAASTKPDVNFSNLVPANTSLVDSYLGLEPYEAQSGTMTLSDKTNFSLVYTMETYSAVTNSITGEYRTALFQDEGVPVFVTKTVNGTGFDGEEWDFQLFLPVNGTETYHLSSWSNVTKISCDSFTTNLTARLINNRTDILLEWNQVPEANHYEIFHSGKSMNFSSMTITGQTNHTITGINDSFFRVKTIFDHLVCDSRVVGATLLNLTIKNDIGFNLVSLPFEPLNDSLQELLEPIYPELDRVYWYDNVNKRFEIFYIVDSGSNYIAIDNIHEFNSQDGYWINVKENTTLPIAGTLINKTEKNLTVSFNLGGFHIMEDNEVTEVFDQMYDELDRVYAYDNVNKLYYSPFMVINDGMGGWIPIVSFSHVKPFSAYYIKVRENTTEVWK
ncbi:MAG: hypothetical protein R6V53_05700 [Candidatus Woesearchaeota archaeon]